MRRSIVTAASRDSGEEDAELTAFIMQQIDIVMSGSHDPSPACPQCCGVDVANAGFRQRVVGRLPQFECRTCNFVFDRTFGTPMSERDRPLIKIQQFAATLSRPLTFSAAYPVVHCTLVDIKNLVVAFRKWLLQLDPSGNWESRIKLGGRFAELHKEALHFDEAGAREDLMLTYQLTQAFDAINTLQVRPFPSCVHCGGSRISIYSGRGPYPRFACLDCKTNFSRRTGTVFAKTKAKHQDRMRAAIRYLSIPLSYMQVSDELEIDQGWLERWRTMFATLADELEPDGSLSSRIRLGVKPTKTTPCPNCGQAGTATKRKLGWGCSGCGRLFSMRRAVVERNGRLEIVDDSASPDG
ncbi:DUF746 domain-containing protein [Burkholderia contaminans]|uniref:DUF746 domain-containing protein n=1 Tax=Burkholderia contaminans TaxID=488447 RepID=UPI00158EEC19|nr:DUF746 domain-containing protein [Burkholderia contaminans]